MDAFATPNGLGDWTPGELHHNGSLVLERICEHLGGLDSTDVTSRATPAEILAAVDTPIPQTGLDFPELLDRTFADVVTNLTQWNHPRFHAYFSNSSSGPAMLAELLTAALNVNVMLWHSAPAAAAVERTVTRWLADMLGYPHTDALLVDGASLGTFYALAAARHRTQPDVRSHGASLVAPGRIYTSDQAHSSIDKAAIALGVGAANVIRLSTGPDATLDPVMLSRRITADIAAGYTPIAVVATMGTTTSGATDPIEEIADVCHRHNTWLHVDAAYGGFWKAVPAIAATLPALARADSLVANPHKVLFTPMECGALFCRHPGALEAAFALVPEYLRTDTAGGIDYMNYTLHLGRQFRALKLWWTLQSFGLSGITTRLQHAVDLADHLRRLLAADGRFAIENTTPLPLLCVRLAITGTQGDPATRAVLEHVNSSHHTLLSHSVLNGHYVIRVSIGNIHTRDEHVEQLAHDLITAADTVLSSADQQARHEEVFIR